MQQNQTEIWKPVVGYEGLYEVSNMGRVRRIAIGRGTRIGRLLSNKSNHNFGYNVVSLCGKGKPSYFTVHSLVAKAFIANPLNLPNINHIDNNPLNNKIENLEWVSCHKNSLHAANQRRMASRGIMKITDKMADSIKHDYANMDRKSMRILSIKYGICLRSVWVICNNKPRSNPNYKATANYIEPTVSVMKKVLQDRIRGLTRIQIARKHKLPYSYIVNKVK